MIAFLFSPLGHVDHAQDKDELSFEKGDHLFVTKCDEDGWWPATHCSTGKVGYAPKTFLELLYSSSSDPTDQPSFPLSASPALFLAVDGNAAHERWSSKPEVVGRSQAMVLTRVLQRSTNAVERHVEEDEENYATDTALQFNAAETVRQSESGATAAMPPFLLNKRQSSVSKPELSLEMRPRARTNSGIDMGLREARRLAEQAEIERLAQLEHQRRERKELDKFLEMESARRSGEVTSSQPGRVAGPSVPIAAVDNSKVPISMPPRPRMRSAGAAGMVPTAQLAAAVRTKPMIRQRSRNTDVDNGAF